MILQANEKAPAEVWNWQPGDATKYTILAAYFDNSLFVAIGPGQKVYGGYFIPFHNALHVALLGSEVSTGGTLERMQHSHAIAYYLSHIRDENLDRYMATVAHMFAALWYAGIDDVEFTRDLVGDTYRDRAVCDRWLKVRMAMEEAHG